MSRYELQIAQMDLLLRYKRLGHMKSDCALFLGCGEGCKRYLWKGGVEEHIAYMKCLWNSFPEDKKPDWLSFDSILEYEKEMKAEEEKQAICRDPRYVQQQEFINQIADRLGVVVQRPCASNDRHDKNTVLLYLEEDHQFNRILESAGVDVSKDDYKSPFWRFENSDVNGARTLDFANQGKLALCSPRWQEVLEGDIRLAHCKRRQNNHIRKCGGILSVQEADDVYNGLNCEQIDAYKRRYQTAYLGKINFYGDKQKKIIENAESVYEEYIGQRIYNGGADFCVYARDEELEALIREWNAGRYSSSEELLEKINDRIDQLDGLRFHWV